jgi:hypothetical protein
MIYAHVKYGMNEQKFEQPKTAGFYERNYNGCWHKDYWDGERWYFVKGGKPAITQGREWREITKDAA